jgi:hypothetical protein
MPLAATEWGGVALFLVPIPVAVVILVIGARRERTDTFMLLTIAVTLLPAVWATAIRADLGGCDGCLSHHERDLMTAALASLPLLAVAIVLLFTGRREAGAGVTILAQILVGIGVWLPNKGTSILMLLLIAGEVAHIVSSRRAERNIENVSGGNGHPGTPRYLSQD